VGDLLKSRERAGLGDASICRKSPDNDLLSEVLRDLRLAHASYGRSELTAPWGLAVPFREGVRFHVVVDADSGDCGQAFRLNAARRSDRRRPPVPTKAAGVSLPA